MSSGNVIYEVNVAVEAARVDEYDTWLADHVSDMLALPGFVSAEQFASVTDDGKALRSVQYRLENEQFLQEYLEGKAAHMRNEAVERFGDDIHASRRILNPTRSAALETCRNCSAPLTGQYCVECGQRHRTRMISIFELLRDVFDDLLSWDARLWRSLRPLLFRPGRLTNEYLNGRRTYYTPPLRMYLVLSVVFFLLTNLTTFGALQDTDLVIDGAGLHIGDTSSQEQRQGAADTLREMAAASREQEIQGGLADQQDNPEANQTAARLETAAAKLEELERQTGTNAADDEPFDCTEIDVDLTLPGISSEELKKLLIQRCERFTAPGGTQALMRQFIDLVPTLLIIMLPLIALASKILYLFSKRYYVEHLLVFTHYHSFVFLFLMLVTGMLMLLTRLDAPSALTDLIRVGAWGYGIYYPFRALRVVFGQGRFVTFIKFSVLIFVYIIGASTLAAIGMLIAALSA